MANPLDEHIAEQAEAIYGLLSRQNLGRVGERDIERLLDPVVDDVRRFERSELFNEARWLCMSLLLALYRFDSHLTPAIRGWPADFLSQLAEDVFFAWKNGADREGLAEMSAFVQDHLGEWGRRLA